MNKNESKFATLLSDKRTPATILLIGLIDEFGTEFFEWEPNTLLHEVKLEWMAEMPTVNRDKIWALVTELTTNLFYQNLEAFLNICQALNNNEAEFEMYDPVDVDDICWAIAEVSLVNPPESETFNTEILTYIEERLKYEGYQKVPKILRKLVSLPERTEEVNQVLTDDAIDFNSHWDGQQRKLLEIDELLRNRLGAIFEIMGAIPLKHADQQALRELRERAAKSLAKQTQGTKQVAQSVSRAPVL